MAIFSDSAGFKYMGDCQWGTLNITYPTQYYLEAHPHSSVSAELTSLCSSAGLSFRNVANQSWFDTLSPGFILCFGANGDIDDRYSFRITSWTATQFSGGSGVYVFNNSGSTDTVNTNFAGTNSLYFLSSALNVSNTSGSITFGVQNLSETVSQIQWVGSSDGSYLALCFFQRNFGTNNFKMSMFYSGQLADINTGYGYYNANALTRTVSFMRFGNGGDPVGGAHYIASAGKNLLQTGDGIYTIACSDGQTPTSQWATDFYAFDNNVTLGYPAIGRVRGMLLGIGAYTTGKPVKIIGSVFPDSGSPWYLPVGTYAGKTLLMRCYSSMT